MLQDWTLAQRAARLSVPGRTSLAWLERNWVAVTFSAGVVLVFAYRMLLVRSHVALGIDAGSYLATMRQFFGTDITGWGLARPPLVGIVLWPLAQLFGPLAATKLLAIAASVLMAVPFYLLCSRLTTRSVALAASLLFVCSPRYMDALNWGFLTLFGVGLFTLCFYLIHEVVTAPTFEARKVVALGLASLALLATNRTSAFVYVLVAVAFGAVAVVVGGQLRKGVFRVVPGALLAMLLVLPFAGLYLDRLGVIGDERYISIVGSADGIRDAWDRLLYFFPDSYPLLWAVISALGITGAVVLARRTRAAGTLLLTMLAALFGLSVLFTGDAAGRAGYYLYVPIWLGLAVCADALVRTVRERRALSGEVPVWGLALLTLVAILTIRTAHVSLQDAAAYYGYLDSEHVDAIETADRLVPAGAGVVYPWTLAEWTEGLAGRRAYSPSERTMLSPQGRGTQQVMADALLSGDRVTTNGSAFVADAYSVGDVPMDPVVGADNGAFKHLLYLDDQLIEIEYGDGLASRRTTLADAELQERVTTADSGAWIDTRSYQLDDLLVTKEVTLPDQGGQATIALSLDSKAGPVTRVLVPLQPALPSAPVTLEVNEALFGFKGWSPFTFDWWTGVYVGVTSLPRDVATLTLTPGEGRDEASWRAAGEPIAMAEVRPESSQAQVTLTFTFVGSHSGDQAGLRTFTTRNAIQYQDITFALVDRQPSQPWFGDPLSTTSQAWLENAPYFQPLWDSGRVAAYRVEPLPEPDGDEHARSQTDGG